MLFISGTFGTIKSSSGIAKVASVLPVRHLIELLVAVFNPKIAGGTGISGSDVGMLLLWGAIGIGVSLRRFRWEPRRP